ncbi:MAG: hypothetical protein ACLFNU_06095 [Bacteroidales bacterium]
MGRQNGGSIGGNAKSVAPCARALAFDLECMGGLLSKWGNFVNLNIL